MDLYKTYVLCIKNLQINNNNDNNKIIINDYNNNKLHFECDYFTSLEEAIKKESLIKKYETTMKINRNTNDFFIFEVFGPTDFHNIQVKHYLSFYNK
jgi:hypothetical protein